MTLTQIVTDPLFAAGVVSVVGRCLPRSQWRVRVEKSLAASPQRPLLFRSSTTVDVYGQETEHQLRSCCVSADAA